MAALEHQRKRGRPKGTGRKVVSPMDPGDDPLDARDRALERRRQQREREEIKLEKLELMSGGRMLPDSLHAAEVRSVLRGDIKLTE